jgi:hypothetical protein
MADGTMRLWVRLSHNLQGTFSLLTGRMVNARWRGGVERTRVRSVFGSQKRVGDVTVSTWELLGAVFVPYCAFWCPICTQ